jgi:hypothetical protein
MLGWEVFVYRHIASKPENLIARWQTSVLGLAWLDALVKQGRATDLGGDGYPNRYQINAQLLFDTISNGLPANNSPVVVGDDYVLPARWNGEIQWQQAPDSCAPDEVLTLVVWDQS